MADRSHYGEVRTCRADFPPIEHGELREKVFSCFSFAGRTQFDDDLSHWCRSTSCPALVFLSARVPRFESVPKVVSFKPIHPIPLHSCIHFRNRIFISPKSEVVTVLVR